MTELVAADVQDFPIHISEDATITKVVVLTRGGPGSCVVDIWKDAFAGYPPTVADSICASAKPTIVSGHKYEDETLTGWTTLVSRGDTLLVHIDSTSTFEAIGVFLELEPVGSVDTDGYTDDRVREIIAEEGLPGSVINEGDNFIITLGSGLHEDLDVFAMCGEPSDPGEITFTIPDGVVVRATTRSRPAVNFAGFASGSEINFINLGHVLGCGGDGGDGGAIVQVFDSPDVVTRYTARAGQTGGPAVRGPGSGSTFLVTNAGGFLWGGGGGGAGGGASQSNGSNRVALGGGGGGGAGGGSRGLGFTAGGASVLAEASSGGDGSGGIEGEGANGGAGTQAGSSTDGGDGGDGGDYGEAGDAGESPTGFSRDLAGGSGGAAGNAIDLNAGTMTFISGGTAPNVKGAVS